MSRLASLENIILRSGRFCNPGASQNYLNLSSEVIKQNHQQFGHKCGDDMDFVQGKATGAIRISFCFANTTDCIDKFIDFIQEYFIIKEQPEAETKFTIDNEELEVLKTFIYPIKSCQAFQVSDWPISNTGFLFDRLFVLVGMNGKVLNLKNCPKMAFVKIENIDRDGMKLVVSINGLDPLEISLVNNDQCISNINAWFTKYLEKECQLVKSEDNVSFVNRSQFLLINVNSYNSLLDSISQGSNHVDILSFRPNIVISTKLAYSELSWVGKTLNIFNRKLKVLENCSRCQMICIDKYGERHPEPLKTLSKSRVQVLELIGKDCFWSVFGTRRLT